jgi:hypothetical protein
MVLDSDRPAPSTTSLLSERILPRQSGASQVPKDLSERGSPSPLRIDASSSRPLMAGIFPMRPMTRLVHVSRFISYRCENSAMRASHALRSTGSVEQSLGVMMKYRTLRQPGLHLICDRRHRIAETHAEHAHCSGRETKQSTDLHRVIPKCANIYHRWAEGLSSHSGVERPASHRSQRQGASRYAG